MVVVAAFAASAGGTPSGVTMTSTSRRTSSRARAGNRAYLPSAHRYSMARLRAFRVAQVAELLPEGVERKSKCGRGLAREEADPVTLHCLLRLTNASSSEHAPTHHGDERSPVHHSIT